MADFNKPDNTSLKTAVLDEIKARATDIARLAKPTNPPLYYVAYDNGTDRLQSWKGDVWENLPLTVNNADNATNAGKLDNLDSTQFMRTDQASATTGNITIRNAVPALILEDTTGNITRIENQGNQITVVVDGVTYKLWHEGSDGVGSGLAADTAGDSDKLDGLHGLDFARYKADGTLPNSLAAGAWITSYGGVGNVDHVWHDDTNNEWNFVSDGTYKQAGNAGIRISKINGVNFANFVQSTSSQALASSNPLSISGNTLSLNTASGSDSVDLNMLGVGQSWVDRTSEMVAGTTYTNGTGQPILVNIVHDNSINLGADQVRNSGSATWINVGASNGGVNYMCTSYIVPNGASYRSYGIVSWSELR